MKQRIITSAVALIVLGAVLAFYQTPVLPVAVAVLAAIASYELLHALDCLAARSFSCLLAACCAAIALAPQGYLFTYAAPLSTVGVSVLLIFFLRYHGRYTAERLGFAAAVSMCVALSFRCIVLMRNLHGNGGSLYALFVALIAAWASDTGAYFAGRLFGRHKLCPRISPKKTVEGAVGGVVAAMVGQLILNRVYVRLLGRPVALLPILIISPLLTVLSIVGDLSASVIKRDAGIKDYGNLFPGHGGVLDRFDSVLPLLPVVYLLFAHLH